MIVPRLRRIRLVFTSGIATASVVVIGLTALRAAPQAPAHRSRKMKYTAPTMHSPAHR